MNIVTYDHYNGLYYWRSKILKGIGRLKKNNLTWYKDLFEFKDHSTKKYYIQGSTQRRCNIWIFVLTCMKCKGIDRDNINNQIL